MQARRDVEVQIEFLPTEHGGRRSAVQSGYRPQLYYDGHDWDAEHEYPDAGSAEPGEHVRSYLTCLSPEFHDGNLVPGKAVLFREGQRVIAFGTITRVIDLPRSAYRARVADSIERYYRALLDASHAASSTHERAVLRPQLEGISQVRRDVREMTAIPDLRGFVAQQSALKSQLSRTSPAMTDALATLELAVAEGPPSSGLANSKLQADGRR
jgi:hypothetical protein